MLSFQWKCTIMWMWGRPSLFFSNRPLLKLKNRKVIFWSQGQNWPLGLSLWQAWPHHRLSPWPQGGQKFFLLKICFRWFWATFDFLSNFYQLSREISREKLFIDRHLVYGKIPTSNLNKIYSKVIPGEYFSISGTLINDSIWFT